MIQTSIEPPVKSQDIVKDVVGMQTPLFLNVYQIAKTYGSYFHLKWRQIILLKAHAHFYFIDRIQQL